MTIEVLMPALSPTMTEGTIAKWVKQEGDTVESGDVIAEIETDKATMEVESVDEGILGKILVPAGTSNVPVNQIIAVLLEDGEDAESIDMSSFDKPANTSAPAAEEKPAAPAPTPAPAPAPTAAPQPQSAADGQRVFASPLAKRLAKEAGLDLTKIQGSGPKGRIVKADIEAAKASGGASISTSMASMSGGDPFAVDDYGFPPYRLEEPNSVRKIVAQRLTESKQTVPHFYLTVECEIDQLLSVRKQMNDSAEDFKLSVNDIIIKAVAMALKAVPECNASWTDEGLRYYDRADVSVAVAIDGGLVTPVVRGADIKGLKAISSDMKDLATRAREGKLAPTEFQGGTFTISNLGMYGIKEFGAIINPPQGAILAVGQGEQRPVVKNGELAVATVMSCTLSVDHRAVDGAVGAEFMAAFKKFIENPAAMLL